MRTFASITLGCKVNRVESDSFEAQLLAQGWSRSDERSADLVLINTCAVTGDAEKKTRKALRRALRDNAKARMLVTGCAAALDPAWFSGLDPRVEVVSKPSLGDLVDRLAADDRQRDELDRPDHGCGAAHNAPCDAARTPLDDASSERGRTGDGFRTRVGIKVQDGCDNACSYCIVHVARGPAWSVPADGVRDQARRIAAAGCKEIILTGIDLGSYHDGAIALDGLLSLLLEDTERFQDASTPPTRFRLSSIEPLSVSDRLIDMLASSNGRVCRHLHIPLQSGSSKVLAEMSRPYGADDFDILARRLREAMPSVALTTDIIAGFPGESDEDFKETCELAKRCRFSKIHVFPYSMREGTPAAKRLDQIAPDVKARRCEELRALSERLRREDRIKRAGTIERALVENAEAATTESYHRIPAPPRSAQGALVDVLL